MSNPDDQLTTKSYGPCLSGERARGDLCAIACIASNRNLQLSKVLVSWLPDPVDLLATVLEGRGAAFQHAGYKVSGTDGLALERTKNR